LRRIKEIGKEIGEKGNEEIRGRRVGRRRMKG